MYCVSQRVKDLDQEFRLTVIIRDTVDTILVCNNPFNFIAFSLYLICALGGDVETYKQPKRYCQ